MDTSPVNNDLKEKITGSWGLISFEQERAGVVTYPLGKDARGALYYLASGHVSVHIARSARAEAIEEVPGETDKILKYHELGYLAYCGVYLIDPVNMIMIHQLEISLYPEWEGGQQVRRMELDEDRLLLSSNGPVGPDRISFHLLWQRNLPE